MEQQNNKEEQEPTITLKLRTFLEILWGFKFSGGDYREKAVPQDEVIAELEKISPEIANRFFKIVKPKPSVEATVWSPREWRTSGEAHYLGKEKAAKENFAADKLTEFMIRKFGSTMGEQFCRSMSLQIARTSNFEPLKLFGLSDGEIAEIKEGKYEL